MMFSAPGLRDDHPPLAPGPVAKAERGAFSDGDQTADGVRFPVSVTLKEVGVK
jgi:hypothetical protein